MRSLEMGSLAGALFFAKPPQELHARFLVCYYIGVAGNATLVYYPLEGYSWHVIVLSLSSRLVS